MFVAIDLYSGVPGSGKSLLCTYNMIDMLLERKNVIANYPIDTGYFAGKKRVGKFFYIPTDKITVPFLVAFAKYNHNMHLRKSQTVVIFDEAEIKFNSRLFDSADRLNWIFFLANHRHFGYDIWLCAQSDRMIDRQIRDLIQTEYKCRAITSFGFSGKCVSLVCGGLFCAVGYDHATRTKFLLPHYYRLHKRKAKVYDTMRMFEGMEQKGGKLGVAGD